MEHLQRGAGRILEGDHLFDAAGVGLLDGQFLETDTGAVQGGLDPLQRLVVTHFPADRDHPVNLAGDDDDPGRAFVHPQVQRGLVGSFPFGESQHTEREMAPTLDI